MKLLARTRIAGAALAIGLAMAAAVGLPAQAKDLGVEGQLFEPIEEDMRVMLMRLMARQDWTESRDELEQSAQNYTKNLPPYLLPRADKTATVWKDVGIVVTEDIYLPSIDWETGSVFEPSQQLAVAKGTYMNPVAKLPAAAIERLFIFDATDPDQLAYAKELMNLNIPQLNFMLVAGDPGELSREMNRPVYHPPATMLEKFHVSAVPTLIGFGRGQHQGHMAVTTVHLPADASAVKSAWFGLAHPGYDPESLTDAAPSEALSSAAAEAQSLLPSLGAAPLAPTPNR
jgi:hypothetical protein